MTENLVIFLIIFLVADLIFIIPIVISNISGWKLLSKRFATTESPSTQITSNVYGSIGGIAYNGVISTACSHAGLFMKVFPLFKFGHPNLLIPWSEVNYVEIEEKRFPKGYKIYFKDSSLKPILLAKKALESHIEYFKDKIK